MKRQNSCRLTIIVWTVLLVLMFIPSFAEASVDCTPSPVTVLNNNESGTDSLRDAIARICDGGTINFNLTYPATITLSSVFGPLLIDKNLTIDGPGAANLTISGGNQVGVFTINSGTVSIQGVTISNGNAGGIRNYGTLTVTNSTISGNTASSGAGIYNERTVTVTNSTISGNTASNDGGGIFNNYGTVTVTNSMISGNKAVNSSGGGINNSGTLIVTNSTISGNTANSGGGGIYNYGTVTVTNSTFTGNNAYYGGGIWNYGTLTVTNSTFTGNTIGSDGGGIYISSGTVTVTNSILSANSRGGIYNIAGTVTVTNSILSANTIKNCFGTITNGGHNIDSANTCGFTTTGSMYNTDPKLDPAGLTDNGGPTKTIALLPGSPAIDAGDATTCVGLPGGNKDQRGKARVGTCDIGSFESQGFTISKTGGDTQSTLINTAFGTSLQVAVASVATPAEPVNGGNVTFIAPSSGASATITGSPAAISGGTASVMATANGTAGGPYNVTASTAGATSVNFSLTNTKNNQDTLFLNAGSPLTYNTSETLSTSGGSGTGAITYEVTSGSCTITGASSDQLRADSGTGTCGVKATKAADSDYNQATATATVTLQYPTSVTIPSATGKGDITLATNTPGCGFSAYSPSDTNDPGYVHPYGLVQFTLNCSQPGAQADVTITFPGSIEGMPYRKYGPTTPGNPATAEWYTFSNVTVNSSTSITLHLTDGALGDDTGVDGVIVDDGGPALPSVPAITEWGMIIFIALAGLAAVNYLRRQKTAKS
jgi:hypothetical protein